MVFSLCFSYCTVLPAGLTILDEEVQRDYGMVMVYIESTGGLVTLGETSGAFFEVGDGETPNQKLQFLSALRIANLAVQSLSFIPADGFTGTGNVTVLVDDQGWSGSGGSLSTQTSLVVEVEPLPEPATNTAPRIASPGPQYGTFGQPLVVTGTEVFDPDFDAGGSLLWASLEADNGVLSLASDASLFFLNETAAIGSRIIFEAPLDALNLALSELTLTAADEGESSLTITVSDKGHFGLGGELLDSVAVPIYVAYADDFVTNEAPSITSTMELTFDSSCATQVGGISVVDYGVEVSFDGYFNVTLETDVGTLETSTDFPGVALLSSAQQVVNFMATAGAVSDFFDSIQVVQGGVEQNCSNATLKVIVDDLGFGGTGAPLTSEIAIPIGGWYRSAADSNATATSATPLNESGLTADIMPSLFVPSSVYVTAGVATSVEDVILSSSSAANDENVVANVTLTAGVVWAQTLFGTKVLAGGRSNDSAEPVLELAGAFSSVARSLDTLHVRFDDSIMEDAVLAITVFMADMSPVSANVSLVVVEETMALALEVADVDTVMVSETEKVALPSIRIIADDIDVEDFSCVVTSSGGVISLDFDSYFLTTTVLYNESETGTSLVLKGRETVISPALNSLVFLPTPNTQCDLAAAMAEVTIELVASATETASLRILIQVEAVNDAPKIEALDSYTTPEDTSLMLDDVVLSDVDCAESTALQLNVSVSVGTLQFLTTGVAGVTTQGSAFDVDSQAISLQGSTQNLNDAIQMLQFVPPQDWNGEGWLGFTISDEGNFGVGTVNTVFHNATVLVTSVNDAPAFSSPDFMVVASSSRTQLPIISIDDVDVSDNDLCSLSIACASGHLQVADGAGLSFSVGAAQEDLALLSVSATFADIQRVLANLSYTPDALASNSVDQIDFLFSDRGHSGSGGPLSASATLYIQVSVDTPFLLGFESSTTLSVEQGSALQLDSVSIVNCESIPQGSSLQILNVRMQVDDGLLSLPSDSGEVFAADVAPETNVIEFSSHCELINRILPAVTFDAPNISKSVQLSVNATNSQNDTAAAEFELAIISNEIQSKFSIAETTVEIQEDESLVLDPLISFDTRSANDVVTLSVQSDIGQLRLLEGVLDSAQFVVVRQSELEVVLRFATASWATQIAGFLMLEPPANWNSAEGDFITVSMDLRSDTDEVLDGLLLTLFVEPVADAPEVVAPLHLSVVAGSAADVQGLRVEEVDSFAPGSNRLRVNITTTNGVVWSDHTYGVFVLSGGLSQSDATSVLSVEGTSTHINDALGNLKFFDSLGVDAELSVVAVDTQGSMGVGQATVQITTSARADAAEIASSKTIIDCQCGEPVLLDFLLVKYSGESVVNVSLCTDNGMITLADTVNVASYGDDDCTTVAGFVDDVNGALKSTEFKQDCARISNAPVTLEATVSAGNSSESTAVDVYFSCVPSEESIEIVLSSDNVVVSHGTTISALSLAGQPTTRQVEVWCSVNIGSIGFESVEGIRFLNGSTNPGTQVGLRGSLARVNQAITSMYFAGTESVSDIAGLLRVTVVPQDDFDGSSADVTITVSTELSNLINIEILASTDLSVQEDSQIVFPNLIQLDTSSVLVGTPKLFVEAEMVYGNLALQDSTTIVLQSQQPAKVLEFVSDTLLLQTALSNNVIYTPPLNFCGQDVALFTITDEEEHVLKRWVMSITVECQYELLDIMAPSMLSVDEDGTVFFDDVYLSIGGLTSSEIDFVDAQNTLLHLTVQVDNGVVSGGVFTDSLRTDDGLEVVGSYTLINSILLDLQFRPNLNFFGETAIEIDIRHSGVDDDVAASSGASRSILIIVNEVDDPPSVVLDSCDSIIAFEDTEVSIGDVWLDDIDSTGMFEVEVSTDHGHINLLSLNTSAVQLLQTTDGHVSLRGLLADLQQSLTNVSYQGNVNFNGMWFSDELEGQRPAGAPSELELLTITVTDLETKRVVSTQCEISVEWVNDGPSLEIPETISTVVGQSALLHNISLSDVDVEESVGGYLTATLSVRNGILEVDASKLNAALHPFIFAFVMGVGSTEDPVVIEGTQDDVQTLISHIQYVPATSFYGADTLSIVLSDNGFSGYVEKVANASIPIVVSKAQYLSFDDVTIEALYTDEDVSVVVPVTLSAESVDFYGAEMLQLSFTTSVGHIAVNPDVALPNDITLNVTSEDVVALLGTASALNAAIDSGLILYQPLENFNSWTGDVVVVSVTATTGADDEVSADVSVTVLAVNDPPTTTASLEPSTIVLEDVETALPAFTVHDVDILDNATGVATLSISATYGSVRMPSCRGLYFESGECNSYAPVLTVYGGLDQLNTALQQVHYMPAADWNSAVSSTNEIQRISLNYAEYVTILSVASDCGNCQIDGGNFTLIVTVGNFSSSEMMVTWNASDTDDVNASTSMSESFKQLPSMSNASVLVTRNENGRYGGFIWQVHIFGVSHDVNVEVGEVNLVETDSQSASDTPTVTIEYQTQGNQIQGSWSASFNTETTIELPFDASAETVAAALETLTTVGSVDVSRRESGGVHEHQYDWDVTFLTDGFPSHLGDVTSVLDCNLHDVSGGTAELSVLTLQNGDARPEMLSCFIDDNGNTGTTVDFSTNASSNLEFLVFPVNDLPTVAWENSSYWMAEDSVTSVAITVHDRDGESLSLYNVSFELSNGVLSLPIEAVTAHVREYFSSDNFCSFIVAHQHVDDVLSVIYYEPQSNFNGVVTLAASVVEVTQLDGLFHPTSSAVSTSTAIIVTAVNDAPTVTAPATVTTNVDLPVLIDGVVIEDADASDTATPLYQARISATHGSVTLMFPEKLAVQVSESSGQSIVLEGFLESLNTALGFIQYAPSAGWEGDDKLVINVSDGVTSVEESTGISVVGVESVFEFVVPSGRVMSLAEDSYLDIQNVQLVAAAGAAVPDSIFSVALSCSCGDLVFAAPVPSTEEFSDPAEVHGTLDDVNKVLGSIVLRPSPDWNGLCEGRLTALNDTSSVSSAIAVTSIQFYVESVDDLVGFAVTNPRRIVQGFEPVSVLAEDFTLTSSDESSRFYVVDVIVTNGTIQVLDEDMIGIHFPQLSTNESELEFQCTLSRCNDVLAKITFSPTATTNAATMQIVVQVATWQNLATVAQQSIIVSVESSPSLMRVQGPLEIAASEDTSVVISSVAIESTTDDQVITVTVSSTHGSVSFQADANVAWIEKGDNLLQFRASVHAANFLLTGLTFLPEHNFYGVATVNVTAEGVSSDNEVVAFNFAVEIIVEGVSDIFAVSVVEDASDLGETYGYSLQGASEYILPAIAVDDVGNMGNTLGALQVQVTVGTVILIQYVEGIGVGANSSDGVQFVGSLDHLDNLLRGQNIAIQCEHCSGQIANVSMSIKSLVGDAVEQTALSFFVSFSKSTVPLSVTTQPQDSFQVNEDESLFIAEIIIVTGTDMDGLFALTLESDVVQFASSSHVASLDITTSNSGSQLVARGLWEDIVDWLPTAFLTPPSNFNGRCAVSVSLQSEHNETYGEEIEFGVVVLPVDDSLELVNITTDVVLQAASVSDSVQLELPTLGVLQDVDADDNVYEVTVASRYGSVSCSTSNALHYLSRSSNGSSLTFAATLVNVNAALSSMQYASNISVSDILSVSVSQSCCGAHEPRSTDVTIPLVFQAALALPRLSIPSGLHVTQGDATLLQPITFDDFDNSTVYSLEIVVDDVVAGNFSLSSRSAADQIVRVVQPTQGVLVISGRGGDLTAVTDGSLSFLHFLANDTWCGRTTFTMNLINASDAASEATSASAIFQSSALVFVGCRNHAPQLFVNNSDMSNSTSTANVDEDTAVVVPLKVYDADHEIGFARSAIDSHFRVSITATNGSCFIAESAVSFEPATSVDGLWVESMETSSIVVFGNSDAINDALSRLVFLPAPNFFGAATVSALVTDYFQVDEDTVQSIVTSATIHFDVVAVTDAPQMELPNFVAFENQSFALIRAEGMQVIDVDGGSETQLYDMHLQVFDGTLDVGSIEGLCDLVNGSTSPASLISLRCTLTDLNQVIATVLYMAADGFSGRDTLHITCSRESSAHSLTLQTFIEVLPSYSVPSITYLGDTVEATESEATISISIEQNGTASEEVELMMASYYSAVPAVQEIRTTVETAVYQVQKISVLLLDNASALRNVGNATFQLSLDLADFGLPSFVTRNISVLALDLRDEEIPSAGSGLDVGESLDSILNELTLFAAGSFEVHKDQFFEPAGVAWDITFVNMPSSLPLFEVVSNATDVEIQSQKVESASQLSGSFSVSFASSETVDVPHDAEAALVKDSIESLSSIDKVHVTRSTADINGGYTWSITFMAPAGNIPLLEVDGGLLSCDDNPDCATVAATIAQDGFGKPYVTEFSANTISDQEVQVVSIYDAAGGSGSSTFEGSFVLGLDLSAFGGGAGLCQIHYNAVAMADDEKLNGGNGYGPGESVQSKIEGMMELDLNVSVTRGEVDDQGGGSWSITFLNAPYYLPQLTVEENNLFGVSKPVVDVFTTLSEFDISNFVNCSNPMRCTCAQEYLLLSVSDIDISECHQRCSDDDECKFVYYHDAADGTKPSVTGCDLYTACDLTREPSNPVGTTFVKSGGRFVDGWLSIAVRGGGGESVLVRSDATETEMKDALMGLLINAAALPQQASGDDLIVSRSQHGAGLDAGYIWTVAHFAFSDFEYTVNASQLYGATTSFHHDTITTWGDVCSLSFDNTGGLEVVYASTDKQGTVSMTGELQYLREALIDTHIECNDSWAGFVSIDSVVRDATQGVEQETFLPVVASFAWEPRLPAIVFDDKKFNYDMLTPSQGVYSAFMNEDSLLSLEGIHVSDDDAITHGGELVVVYVCNHGVLDMDPTITDSAASELSIRGTAGALIDSLATIVYRPQANWFGDDVVNISVSTVSSGSTAVAWDTLVVRVESVNDPPHLECGENLVVVEDTAVSFSVSVDDDDALQSQQWRQLDVNITTLTGATSLTAVAPGLNNISESAAYSTLRLSGTVAAMQSALSSLTYTPPENWFGIDYVKIEVSDNGNAGSGGALLASCMMLVTVESANDQPKVTLPAAMYDVGELVVDEDDALVIKGVFVEDIDSQPIVENYPPTQITTGVIAQEEVQVVSIYDAAGGPGSSTFEGSFVLGLDLSAFGGGAGLCQIHYNAVAMADDEKLNGGNGYGPGESVQSKIEGMMELDLNVSVTRGEVDDQGGGSWSITFLNAPYYLPQLTVEENNLFGVSKPVVDVFTTLSEFDISNFVNCSNPMRCTCAQEYLLLSVSDIDISECHQRCSDDDECKFVYYHDAADGTKPSVTGCDLYTACDLTREPSNPVGTTFVKSGGRFVDGWMSIAVRGGGGESVLVRSDATETEMKDALIQVLDFAMVEGGDQLISVERTGPDLRGGYSWTASFAGAFVMSDMSVPELVVQGDFTDPQAFVSSNTIEAKTNDVLLQLNITVTGGTVSLRQMFGLTVVDGTGDRDSVLSFLGLQSDINDALDDLLYVPALNWNSRFNGVDTIQIVCTDEDGGQSSVAPVVIRVTAMNDAPVISVPGEHLDPVETTSDDLSGVLLSVDSIVVTEDVPSMIAGISVRDVDAMESGELVDVTVSCEFGSLTMDSIGVAQNVSQGTGSGDKLVSFAATIENANSVLSSLVYVGDEDYYGDDTIVVSVSDGGVFGSGGQLFDTVVVPIVVAPVNDPPFLNVPRDLLETDEDLALTLSSVDVGDVDSSALSVIVEVAHGNISIYPTSNLTFLAETGGSSVDRVTGHQESYMQFSGSLDQIQRALSALVYFPPRNWNTLYKDPESIQISVTDSDEVDGTDGFFTVSDFVEINVIPVNDNPRIDASGAHFLYVYDGVDVITEISSIQLREDSQALLRDLTIIDIDADESFVSTMELQIHCSHGKILLGSTVGLFFKYPLFENGMATVIAEGTLVALNDALDTVAYVPDLDYHGKDELLIVVSDNGNTGPTATGQATVHSSGVSEIQCMEVVAVQSSSLNGTDCYTSNMTLVAPGIGGVEIYANEDEFDITAKLRDLYEKYFEDLENVDMLCRHNTTSLDDGWSDVYIEDGMPACSSSRVPLYIVQSSTDFSLRQCIHFSAAFGDVQQMYLQSESECDVVVWTEQDGALPHSQALFASEVIPVEIKSVNDVPSISVPSGTLACQEDQSTSFAVSIADVDVALSGNSLYRVTLSAGMGLLKVLAAEQLNSTTSVIIGTRTTDAVRIDPNTMWADFISLEGSLDAVNVALENLLYQPAKEWNSDHGTEYSYDTITVRVDDLSHYGVGSNLTSSAVVKVQLVSGINDAPTITVPGMHFVSSNCTTVEESAAQYECQSLLAVDVIVSREDEVLTIAGVVVDDPDVHETYGSAVDVSLKVHNGSLFVGTAGVYFIAGDGRTGSDYLQFRCSLPRCNDALSALQYVPNRDWFGMDQLTITISDLGFSGVGGPLNDNVTIPIEIVADNDPPTCVVPSVNFEVEEDMNVALVGISVDDVDGADGDIEIVVKLSAEHGTLSMPPLMEEHLEFFDGDFSTGILQPGEVSWRRFSKSVSFSGSLARVKDALAALEYVPDLNFNSDVNGTDKIVMSFADSAGAVAECEAFVNVVAINDAPFLSSPQAQKSGDVTSDGIDFMVEAVADFAVDENQQVVIDGTSVRDVDLYEPQRMAVTISCEFGELSLVHTVLPALLFSMGDGVNDTFMAFSGHINDALNQIVYSATSEFGDSDHVVITVSDNGFSGAGTELSDSLSIPITVYSQNDAPTILVPLHQDNSSLQHIGEEDTLLLSQDILYSPSAREKYTRLTTGYELWRTEAVRPIHDADSREWRSSLVQDINTGSDASHPSYFTIFNTNGTDMLYFQADDGETGTEFWRSDGSEAGTELVEDLYPGGHGSDPKGFTVFNDLLYFAADGVDNKWMLTTDECGGVRTSSTNEDVVFVVSEDTVWQPSKNYECPIGYYWASTKQAQDLFTTPESNNEAGVEYSYFGQCGWSGFEWEHAERRTFRFSDSHIFGSTKEAGTSDDHVIKVADFSTNNFAGIVCIKGDGAVCDRLYQTDNPRHAGTGGSCFHRAGTELWSSDGTVQGTVRVVDIERGFASSNPQYLTPLNNSKVMLFQATTREYGSELWRTDGTIDGTFIVADINVGASSSTPSYITLLNGKALFAADDGWRGNELWLSDGSLSSTGRTTHVVKDINPGDSSSDPQHFVVVNAADMPALSGSAEQYAFFNAVTEAAGAELWVTDGTLSGTAMVHDIYPGSSSSNPSYLVNYDGQLFFQADGGIFGPELWVSDGTSSGTRQLKDIAPGSAGSSPSFLTLFRPEGRPQIRPADGIFFVANAGISSTSCRLGLKCRNSFELWVTDGTASGTTRAFEHSFRDFDLDPWSFELQRSVAMINFDGAFLMSFNGLVDEVVTYSSVERKPRQQSIAIVDVDGEASTAITVHMYASKGTLSLSLDDDTNVTFTEGVGTNDQSLTFTGTEDAINDALTAVLYHALPDQTGWDEVVISTDESGATSQSSIAILIDAVNDAPSIDAPSSLVAYPDVELSIFGTTVEDVDVDDTYAGKNGTLTMKIELEQGHITLNSLLDLTFTVGDGVFDKELEFTGTKLNLNKAIFNLKYKCWTGDTATGCSIGKDTIKLTLSDNGYSGSGGAQTVVTVIDISVQDDTTIDVSTYL